MWSATTLGHIHPATAPLLTCTLFEEVCGRVGGRCTVFLFLHGI